MCQEYPKHEIYIALDYQISCSVLAWFCRLMEATANRRDISPANFVDVICLYNSWRCSNTSYRYDMDVGAVWKVYYLNHSVVVWFAHLHHLGFQPTPPNLGKICCGTNSVSMQPCAHPQQLKVLKHLICMTWMWDAFWNVLQPQPMLNGIVCTLASTSILANFHKPGEHLWW